jgi:hypothetical protein
MTSASRTVPPFLMTTDARAELRRPTPGRDRRPVALDDGAVRLHHVDPDRKRVDGVLISEQALEHEAVVQPAAELDRVERAVENLLTRGRRDGHDFLLCTG